MLARGFGMATHWIGAHLGGPSNTRTPNPVADIPDHANLLQISIHLNQAWRGGFRACEVAIKLLRAAAHLIAIGDVHFCMAIASVLIGHAVSFPTLLRIDTALSSCVPRSVNYRRQGAV